MVELPQSEPSNELEKALLDAFQEPGLRPRFFEVLLGSDLLVLGEISEDDEGGQSIEVAQMEHEGHVFIPVFTSVERLQEFVEDEQSYVGLSARLLFESRGPGVSYVLNPGSDLCKEFSSEEIEALLDGTLFDVGTEMIEDAGQEIQLGRPATDPTELVAALIRFFETRSDVEAAYLAQMFIPDSGESPHVVIGIEATEDCPAVIKAAAYVVGQVAAASEPVDFLDIGAGGEIAQYMLDEIEPFFKR